MKKIFCFVLVFFFVTALVSCEKDNNEGHEKQETSTIYEIAKTSGFKGDYNSWLNCLKGTEEKSSFELVRENGYSGTLDEWLLLNTNDQTKLIVLSVNDKFVLWKFIDSNDWNKLVSLKYLKGTLDDKIEFSTTPTNVVWKLENGTKWISLLELSTLNIFQSDKNLGVEAYEVAKQLGDKSTKIYWFLTIGNKSNGKYEVITKNGQYMWKDIDDYDWDVLFESSDFENTEPEVQEYTVKFIGQNGQLIKEILVPEGSYITDIPLYENEGYIFKGWQTNYKEWNFSKDVVTNNIDLYPILEKIYYIHYELNGGEFNGEVIYEFTEFSNDFLPSAKKSQYVFNGWYLEDTYMTKVEKTFDLPHRNVTLYAKFDTATSEEYYYHTALIEDLGSVNYWNSKQSTVGKLSEYIHNGFWGTRMNEYKDGYEWYNVIANEKPRLLNPLIDGEGNEINLGTKYEFEVKVGTELKYNTLSTYPEFAKFKGQEVKPEDYLTTLKHMYNQFNSISQGSNSLTGDGSIKGLSEYYTATANKLSKQEVDALWENVCYDIVERDGKWYIQVEFNVPCNPFYAMYYLSSNLYTPLPEEFIQLVGGLKYYGTFSTDNTLSPVDTTLSTGYYVAKSWDFWKEIVFVKNDMIDSGNMYNFPGVHIQVIQNNIGDTEVVFKEFLAGHLDAASIPTTRLENYKDHELTAIVPDSNTLKLNINSCTQEEWEALFGENGSVSQTEKENYWECEPLMSNDNFLRGLSYSINRKEYADMMLKATPTGNYFGSNYLSDPEKGITYNSTEAHRLATETTLANTDGYGYNFELAQSFFKAACDELIANGTYKAGDTIEIEITWQTHAQVDAEGVILAKYIEDAFNSCGGGLTVKCVHWVAQIWSDVYYKKMMVGQFDIGFGSISGSALNPLDFLEVLRSDNTSGFTLNWGTDTGKVSDQIFYDGMYWSYNALWQAADSGAYVIDGELAGSLVDAVLVAQTVNEDGSVDVEIKWEGVDDINTEFAVSKIAVCNYEVYYQGGDYEEIYVEFQDNDGIVSFTIPAEYNAKINGFIGYDVYFDSKIAGVPGSTYLSLYSSTNAESVCSQHYMGVWSEPNAEAAPVVPEGGQVFSYVASSYEERTKIIGILEKFAVENFLTGITLYGDGGFVMYSDRIVPGSGSWDNYIPGYGYGVFTEGYPNGLLTPVK